MKQLKTAFRSLTQRICRELEGQVIPKRLVWTVVNPPGVAPYVALDAERPALSDLRFTLSIGLLKMPEYRAVAEAIAKAKEQHLKVAAAKPVDASRSSVPDGPLVSGVKILSFTPKSDGEKAGLQKGDVIIEYHGAGGLTTEKFLALTLETRKKRVKPVLVFVRDGFEYAVRVNRGFLGIAVMDTTLRGPFKKAAPRRDTVPKDKKKRTKPLEWT